MKKSTNENTNKLKKEYEAKLIRLAKQFTHELIKNGTLKPDYTSLIDLIKDVKQIANKNLKKYNSRSIDYKNYVLERAQIFLTDKEYIFTCILYAIWTEHFINGLISKICERKEIHLKCGLGLIKKCNIEDKFTWVLLLLDKIKINTTHLKKIKNLFDYRNYYVHYKWQIFNKSEKLKMEELVTSYSKTITYLKQIESKYLYSGKKTSIDKLIK
jgi:hypothetical protein